ncbi:hypothetical protein OIU85_018998 [Salix viminalis]|uniref:Uncharacterized protein n=1 Tax=Salix viminalis TaxID=40686 RepID=A0A9Q0UW84_SALVM|nr:hypothetical protein OIU85_018998 [Salix viminalis]
MEGYLFHNPCQELLCRQSYNITVTQVGVGTTAIDAEFASPFDSGLVDAACSSVSEKIPGFLLNIVIHHHLPIE